MPDQIKPEINTNHPTMGELMAANPTPEKQFYDIALQYWALVYAHEAEQKRLEEIANNQPKESPDGNQA